MMVIRELEELDELVYAADFHGQHLVLAEQLCGIADSMPRADAWLRAEVLVAAAEQFQTAGEFERSLACARAAVADGGEVRYGALAHLAAALHAAGQHDEARAVIARLWRGRPTDVDIHLFVGGQCERHGDVADALRWYTRGLVLAEREEAVEDCLHIGMLLIARWRLREAMGMPADDWDQTADRMLASAQAALAPPLPTQRRAARRSCPCGSGRRPKRCCDGAATPHDVLAAVTSTDGAATYLDLVSR